MKTKASAAGERERRGTTSVAQPDISMLRSMPLMRRMPTVSVRRGSIKPRVDKAEYNAGSSGEAERGG